MASNGRKCPILGSRWIVIAVAVVGAALLVGCDAITCDETAERSATAASAGIETVRVIAEAGSLDIEGKSEVTEISMEGTACAANTSDLDEIQFEVGTSGSELLIEARTPDGSSRFDVRVDLPASVVVDIEDGSGEIRVRDVAAVRISDGSGEVDVSGVSGDLFVDDDGSGNLDLRDITGSVEVDTDGSGDIMIARVNGDVRIGDDGSGDISIEQVGGDVRIGADGSGNIDVNGVDGDFVVTSDGSGGISYEDVAGSIDIPD